MSANTNWYPNLPDPPPIPSVGYGNLLWGTEAPTDSTGANGDLYVNITTGDVYYKGGDTWTITTGGAAVNNLTGSGSPETVVTPDYIGQMYTDLGPPSSVWVATGATANDWIEVAGNLT